MTIGGKVAVSGGAGTWTWANGETASDSLAYTNWNSAFAKVQANDMVSVMGVDGTWTWVAETGGTGTPFLCEGAATPSTTTG